MESEALARRTKPLSHIIPTRSRRYTVVDDLLFASSHPVNPSLCAAHPGQGRRVETLGLHHLLGDGEVGAFVPESAGGDFIVRLADVRNSRDVEV